MKRISGADPFNDQDPYSCLNKWIDETKIPKHIQDRISKSMDCHNCGGVNTMKYLGSECPNEHKSVGWRTLVAWWECSVCKKTILKKITTGW